MDSIVEYRLTMERDISLEDMKHMALEFANGCKRRSLKR